MKYSFTSFSCPELTLPEVLALAKRIGYDGVELRLAEGHKHGVETDISSVKRREIKAQVTASGIALACLGTSCTYADPARAADMVAETRRAIQLAADIGCPRLRVFGGEIPTGITREQAMDSIVASLRAVAAQALESGVIICMETHDDWTNPDQVAEIMRRVNQPSIAVTWDVMHPVRQSHVTMDQAFQALQPWIKHVHFHDGVNRLDKFELKPIGEGDFDHRRMVELLMAAGYDGFLSGEWIGWEPYEIHLPRELATMKRYEREVQQNNWIN
ncbi:MAG: sugar phosphate isomerase/epimerase family protein [Anaerolineae bacterium]|nr:sugar phosphate isomerase/epimerase [Anaerolineae bacterium]MDW8099790.1 sugar phosphate isomerase/epimerase family protein [Anaerolineae bacterium]